MASIATLRNALSAIPRRKIGGTDVFPIGYGTMGLSAYYGAVADDEDRLKVLDAVYESGCNYWDTADLYGDSEELLGKWFKKTGKRSDIFLSTKFGSTPEAIVNGTPEYVRSASARSLARLGTEYIDLYYLHRPDPKTPIEHTVAAMAELVKEGKVRHLGLSECSADTIRRANAIHPIAAVQVEYSPFTLDVEDPRIKVLETCRELGVVLVAYAPLGRGLLSGRITSPDQFSEDDFRKIVPRFSEKNFPKILTLVDGLKLIGEKYGATASQVTLAWILAQGVDFIPIPGTTKIKTLEENLRSTLINLTSEDLKQVRHVAKEADLADTDRYPPIMQKSLFGDTPAPPAN